MEINLTKSINDEIDDIRLCIKTMNTILHSPIYLKPEQKRVVQKSAKMIFRLWYDLIYSLSKTIPIKNFTNTDSEYQVSVPLICSAARSFYELYISFIYFCIEVVDEDTRNFRLKYTDYLYMKYHNIYKNILNEESLNTYLKGISKNLEILKTYKKYEEYKDQIGKGKSPYFLHSYKGNSDYLGIFEDQKKIIPNKIIKYSEEGFFNKPE